MGPKSLRNVSNALAVSLLLSPVALAACTGSETSRLVITQTTDAPAGADHKGHVSPGVFTGITLSIRNSGAGAARGVVVEDVLPEGFHYYELTTLGGNAIRTATSDPGIKGNPSWGTWTIPAGTGNTVSALVLSFKVQVPLNPGERAMVQLTINPAATNHPLSYWDSASSNWTIARGFYPIYVGSSSADIKLTGTILVRPPQ